MKFTVVVFGPNRFKNPPVLPAVRQSTSQTIGLILVGLLVVDVLFLIVHASRVRYGVPGSGLWLISRDRGFPEIWQYLKEASIVVVLLSMLTIYRSLVYGAWAAVFVYLLADDSLEVHETAGEALATGLSIESLFGIEGRDIGQILVSGAVGVVVVVVVGIATARDRTLARMLSLGLMGALLLLAFFGVVVDVIDALDIFGLVEDGGEMLTMSLALVLVLDHRWRRSSQALPGTVSGDSLVQDKKC